MTFFESLKLYVNKKERKKEKRASTQWAIADREGTRGDENYTDIWTFFFFYD